MGKREKEQFYMIKIKIKINKKRNKNMEFKEDVQKEFYKEDIYASQVSRREESCQEVKL